MKTNCRINLSSFSLSLVTLCMAALPAHADVEVMNRVLKQTPALSGIAICHGGGCARVTTTDIASEEWQQLQHVCQPMPAHSEAERTCIAEMLAGFERVIGAKTGTNGDRGGTFGNSAHAGQMDCNDEAINTTNYLKLMQQQGLLRFHEIMDVARRGFFFNGWPHTTAVIREIGSSQRYAVDAWFYDNGQPAVIIPFETWKSGWKPDDSRAR